MVCLTRCDQFKVRGDNFLWDWHILVPGFLLLLLLLKRRVPIPKECKVSILISKSEKHHPGNSTPLLHL